MHHCDYRMPPHRHPRPPESCVGRRRRLRLPKRTDRAIAQPHRASCMCCPSWLCARVRPASCSMSPCCAAASPPSRNTGRTAILMRLSAGSLEESPTRQQLLSLRARWTLQTRPHGHSMWMQPLSLHRGWGEREERRTACALEMLPPTCKQAPVAKQIELGATRTPCHRLNIIPMRQTTSCLDT